MSTNNLAETATTIVVGISEYVERLKESLLQFEVKNNRQDKTILTNQMAFNLIQTLFDDLLNERLRWARETKRFDELALTMIPWLELKDTEGSRPYLDEFYTEVVDELEIKLSECLDSVVGYRTWIIWSTRRLGFDIALQRGSDYRIVDWEGRMSRGEWSHDK